MTKRDVDAIRRYMKAFISNPGLREAGRLEVALDILANAELESSEHFATLSRDLAQYHPDGGAGLFSRNDLVTRVEAALRMLDAIQLDH